MHAKLETRSSTTTRWGRSKWFGGRVAALSIAIPAGLVLGAAVGTALALTGLTGADPVLGGVVFGACLSMPFIALVYALTVDRDTMAGALARPEESIENAWIERAHAGALGDVVLIVGVAATVLTFVPMELPVNLVLAAVILLALASTAARYAWHRSRD